ncbi:MAG: glyoxalase/bleomycin resistance protein/dioxygenase [Frankiales bacterium]|nr:glyoxalase/bleomycin resistance protein/dioxygenase [Frankiales bacterium]
MTSSIYNTSVDCADPWQLAQFWSQVLDKPIDPDCRPGDEEVAVQLGNDHDLLFLRVPQPKTLKNRMHLCLQPDQAREAEVDRLLGLGATLLDDRRSPDGTGWAVLADPEGNELCVLRSAAERAATS